MKCKVKRDSSGKFIDVINPDTQQRDPLYQSILDKVTKDPQSYIDTDEFIRGLYSTNLLVDVNKEEIALGIWAKVHQYWINTNTSPIEKNIPVQAKALTPKDEAYFPPMPESMQTSAQPVVKGNSVQFDNLEQDATVKTRKNDLENVIDSIFTSELPQTYDKYWFRKERQEQLNNFKSINQSSLNNRQKKTINDLIKYLTELINLGTSQPSQPASNEVNVKEFTNHSGGAKGYDAEWDLIGAEFGMVNNKHYLLPSDGNVSDSRLRAKGVKPVDASSDVGEVALQGPAKGEAQIAVTNAERIMGRIEPNHVTRNTKKIRNYAQVKNSDGVFAIGSLIPKGTDITISMGRVVKKALVPQVNGGTSVAVQLGIMMDKPVFVFNQVANDVYSTGWYKWDNNIKDFVKTNIPTLTKNFAGIGTSSNTTELGKQAIRDVYQNSFSEVNVNEDLNQTEDTSKLENFKISTPSESKRLVYTLYNSIAKRNITKNGYKLTLPEFPNVELYITQEHYSSDSKEGTTEWNIKEKKWFIEVNHPQKGAMFVSTNFVTTKKDVIEAFVNDINNKHSKSEHGRKALKEIGINLTAKEDTSGFEEVMDLNDEIILPNALVKSGIEELFNGNYELAKIGSQQAYSQYLDTIFPDSKVRDIVYHGTKGEKFDEVDFFKNYFGGNAFYVTKYRNEAIGYSTKKGNIISLLINSKNIQFQRDAFFGNSPQSIEEIKQEIKEIKEAKFALQYIAEELNIEVFNSLNEANEFAKKNSGWEKLEDDIKIEKLKELENILNVLETKGEFDTVLTNNDAGEKSIYIVNKPEQIHILGSKQDIEGFKEFVSQQGPNASEQILNTNLVENIFTEYDNSIEGFEEFQDARSFNVLNRRIEENIRYFERRINTLKTEKRDANKRGDSAKVKEVDKKLATYDLKKVEAEKQLAIAKNLNGLTGLEESAEFHLNELEALLDQEELPLNTLLYIGSNLSFWKAVSTVDNFKDHILYENKEDLTPEVVQRLTELGARPNALDFKYMNHLYKTAAKEIPKKLKGNLEDIDQQLRQTKDISSWAENFLDISAYGDAVLTWIQVIEKEAVSAAQLRIANLISEFEDSFSKVRNKLDKNYDILQQKYADGRKTNRLVYRFSPEFFEASQRARNLLLNNKSEKKYSEFAKWMEENEIMMNPIILFPTKLGDEYHWGQSENMYSDYDQAMREKHIQELKETLGERDFDMYMERMQEKINTFIFQYHQIKQGLMNNGLSGQELEIQLKNWELENSPYYFAQRILHNKTLENSEGIIVRNIGYSFVESIPRKFRPDGSETGYYDKNYEKIQADPQLAEFYETLLGITHQLANMLPSEKRKELGINGLPFLAKDITELFAKGNWIGMTEELMDQMVNLTRSPDEDDIDRRDRDPQTGRVNFKTRLHLNTGAEEVKSRVKAKMIEYRLQEAAYLKTLSVEERQAILNNVEMNFRKDIVNDLQSQRSEDLSTTMKAYIMATVMYHHKANVEDMLNIMSQFAGNRGAFVVEGGVIQTNKETGLPIVEGEAKKKIESLRFNIEAFLTGKTHKTQGKSDTKSYTSAEKKRKAEWEKLLAEAESKLQSGELTQDAYDAHKEAIEEELAKIGGTYEAAKFGDAALKWVQLKGLGWNMLAGLNNFAFGYVSNSIEAASGEFMDEMSLAESRKMLGSSVARNLSFNHYSDSNTKKIRKMIELFDVLKDASTELYKAGNKSTIASRFRFLSPFQVVKRIEYVNQGQTFIAHMLFKKVKDLNGNEFSMWEAFDNNGVWKTEQFGEMDMVEFAHTKTSVDQLIKRLHGNYDELSPLKIKESIEGRALIQFKSWFPETWRKYFGKETPDYILGDQYKGRYITIWDNLINSDTRSKTFTASISEILRKYLNVTTFGAVKNFSDPNAFSFMTEVDMRNMKRNIHQFIFQMNLFAMYYLLKYLADDDDEDKLFNASANIAIHQISRLTGELEMYSSPTALMDFTKNLLPMSMLVQDLNDIKKATVKTMGGDGYMQSGNYEGWPRIIKETGESIPLLAPSLRYWSVLSGESQSKEATLIEAAIGE